MCAQEPSQCQPFQQQRVPHDVSSHADDSSSRPQTQSCQTVTKGVPKPAKEGIASAQAQSMLKRERERVTHTPSLDTQNTIFSFCMPPHGGHSPSEPFLSSALVAGHTDVMIRHAAKQTGSED